MKPKSIRDYLGSTADSGMLKDIVNDFEEYERTGEIGFIIRRIEQRISSVLFNSESYVTPTLYFDRIALEAYRLLYEKEYKQHQEFRARITNIVNHY